MRIRIMQYSLAPGDFVMVALGIFVLLCGFFYFGPSLFIGIIFLFLGAATAVRILAHWLVLDGPLAGGVQRDSFTALTLGLIGLIFLLI